MKSSSFLLLSLFAVGCASRADEISSKTTYDTSYVAKPKFVTDSVKYDSDDPAIWIDQNDPSKSLIIGTDKGGELGDGALYVFDLNGKLIESKTVRNIKRPNNVDIAYNMRVDDQNIDIAVCTERNTNSIRVFSLPDMQVLDGGGIPVFDRDSLRSPMGIALYTAAGGKVYAIISRKSGPTNEYLWQYELIGESNHVSAKLVRKFGQYSSRHEIEAVAVDNELGYVYYSDEGFGVRKYYAHPDSSNQELASFGLTGFTDNHEGISIYKESDSTGYVIVSDQQANRFQLFSREGSHGNPHDHTLIRVVKASTVESDGNEVYSSSLPGFPNGLFVAMSDDKTFQVYDWKEFMTGSK